MGREVLVGEVVERATVELVVRVPAALRAPARLAIGAVVAGGGVLIAFQLPKVAGWDVRHVVTWAVLAAAIALTEQFTIPMRHRTETENFSLTDAVWVAGLLLAPADVLLLAVAAGALVGQARRRWRPHKVAFNVGQYVLGVALAVVVYRALGAAPPDDPRAWAAALVSMSACFAVNVSSVALVIALVERTPFRSVVAGSLRLDVLHWAGNMALGILAVILWTVDPLALAFLSLPVALGYLGFRATFTRMAGRVEAADRRERRLLSELSHELRTPITICRGHLDVLGPDPTPEQVQETAAVLVDELDRMAGLVGDMTTLARAEHPGFVRREDVPVERFVEQLALKAEPLLNGRFRLGGVPAAAVIRADPHRLTQALMNLLRNAATYAEGPVELQVEQDPAWWRLEVADHGPGLRPGEEEDVFQPFRRGVTRVPGTGLGLAIVDGIARAHGGTAGVENRPGEGATFWIRVPR